MKKFSLVILSVVVVMLLSGAVMVSASAAGDSGSGFFEKIGAMFKSLFGGKASVTGNVIGDISQCPSGMVSYWGGDGNANDNFDSNNGVWTGTPTYAAGKAGKAFSFKGGSYIETPVNGLNVANALSISAWIKPGSLSANNEIISRTSGSTSTGDYTLIIVGNQLWFTLNNGAVSVAYTLSKVGQWYHIVGTYDLNQVTLYVNGLLVNGTAYTQPITNTYSKIRIGGRSYSTRYFNGLIDELAIFNRALSASEVSDMYNKAGNGYCGVVPVCGNGIVDGGEACDGSNLNGQTCQSLGFLSGTLGCKGDCMLYDTSSCTPICTTGMLSWWQGERNTGDSIDSNNGTWGGTPIYAAGKVGQAFSFSGGSYVSMPANGLNIDVLSVSAWIKPASFSGTKEIMYKAGAENNVNGDYGFYHIGNQLYFMLNNGAVSVSYALPQVGQWYHVVGTYDLNQVKLYVNGVLVNSAAYTGTIANGYYNVRIGGRSYSTRYFNGLVDEPAIFNRALTASEIADMYNKADNGYCGVAPVCGNGIVDGGEACDGSNLNGQTCQSLGFLGGTLGCRADCILPDTSNCISNCTTGMLSWWKGESNTADSIDSNLGTWTGTPTYVAGKVGSAFSFNGGSYIETSAIGLNIDVLSVSAWIKPASFSGTKEIMYKAGAENNVNGDYGFYHTGNQLYFMLNNNVVRASYALPQVGQWYHVVGTYDLNQVKLYVNGVLVNSAAYTGTIANGYYNVRIGGRSYSTRYFNGLVDEPAIFNRALTASEIVGMYSNGQLGYCREQVPVQVCGDGNVTGTEQCDVGAGNVGNNKCIAGQPGMKCNNCVLEDVSNVDETCNNKDDDCRGTIDEGLTQICGVNTIGECTLGFATCKAGSYIGCTAKMPRSELCDGKDNDCDGTFDEGLVDVACGGDAPGCVPGVKSCVGAQWAQCTATGGTPEVCDGVDNDCDTLVDETCDTCSPLGATRSCTTACGIGTQTCSGTPLHWGGCVGPSPTAEVCDGIDNNCNGVIDEGITESCTLPGGGFGVRTCEIEGTGTWGACDYITQGPEICDGLDNDINGVIDDNTQGSGMACDTGKFGICAAGTTQCVDAAIRCMQNVNSAPENTLALCSDGLDNDCDGLLDAADPDCCIDADGDGYGANGAASCEYSGVDCNDNNAAVHPGAADAVCNGIDDDCDGTVDEDYVSTPTTCGIGACSASGQLVCQAGTVVDTCTSGASVTETCNGIDDDCDGTVDNNLPPTGAITECGVGACASTGFMVCQNGQMVDTCVAGTPTTETCNGIDDNCDGTVDEGYIPTPTSCGVGACAAEGQLVCLNGVEENTCTPGTPAADDASCNAIDDDCSGLVDEDYFEVPTTCGVDLCASTGALICENGATQDTCAPKPAVTVYFDADSDAYGNGANSQDVCTIPRGYLLTDDDCNDADATINPGADDICTIDHFVIDKDCNPANNGELDCNDFCGDVDGDTYVTDAKWGEWGGVIPSIICPWIVDKGDCNDNNAAVNPGAADAVCNGIDDNCNGQVDEGYVPTPTTCGIGACSASGQLVCQAGAVVDTCTPGTPVTEVCNGIDDNCNGVVDDLDADSDGLNDCSGADKCLGSVADNMALNPNQYAQINFATSAFESGPKNDQSIVYSMQNTKGCTCTQIVAKLGVGVGQITKGCAPGIMQQWTGIDQNPDRVAGIGKK